jgi:peptide/nickel transport system substrate-binding protein
MILVSKPRRAFKLAALALVGLLAACGEPRSVGGHQASVAGERLSYPATDYYQNPADKPRDGGELRAAATRDAGTLDLHAIAHGNAQWLGRLIYDNLVYLDDKGAITPWLARSWEVSADGKTYTFHLRKDVTFSDGAPFDAEAVRVNLEHMRDPATKSQLAAAYIAPYDHGEVVDPFTFRAHLRQPYQPFLDVLAQSWLAMESPRAITEHPKTLGDHPVGSGPYIVESYTRQQSLHLVRRKDYHWAPDFIRHAGPAHIERITIDVVPEAITRYTALSSGQYGLLFEAPLQNAAAIRSDPDLVFDSRMRTGVAYRGLTFNTQAAPFDDVRVRRAFTRAVNRDAIVHSIGFGEIAPKADYMSANTLDYDPSFRNVLTYDVAAANRLLDEAGWTGRDAQGFRTRGGRRLAATALIADTGNSVPVAVAIQSDVRKIGFDLELQRLPTAQLTDRRNSGDYQALGEGVWHTNTPDALYIVFDSAEISSAKRIGQNSARLRDAQLDSLLEDARRSSDPARLKALYSRAQKRLVELVPAVPLYENDSITARRADLHGVIFDTSHNTPILTTAWLEGRSR